MYIKVITIHYKGPFNESLHVMNENVLHVMNETYYM